MHGSIDLTDLMRRLARAAGTPRELLAGEILFRASARVRALYIVEAGELRLVRHPRSGQSVTLQAARAGDLLAEASLFSGRYHCDAVAAANARVLGFNTADVRRGFETQPGDASMLAAHLARQAQQLRSRVALLTIRSAEERLIAYLDSLRADAGAIVDPGHSWTTVASEIGLSHEAVYRALASLERTGRIERAGRTVRVRSGSVE